MNGQLPYLNLLRPAQDIIMGYGIRLQKNEHGHDKN